MEPKLLSCRVQAHQTTVPIPMEKPMDQTEQRLREFLHLVRDDPGWEVKVTKVGVQLSYYQDGYVIHQIVDWEELRTDRVNPLPLKMAGIKRRLTGEKG